MINQKTQDSQELTTEELKAIKNMGIEVHFDEKQAEREAQILKEFKY